MFWNGHSDQCECLAHWTFDLCLSNKISVGKESTCNAGDPGLVPGLGRSAGEGKICWIYPFQCSWASLVAQLVKNPPAMQETWIRSLGLEDPLLLLLSHFSRVRLCATPETAAHQAPSSLGFSRQEHWSGLPFPSPMCESEKWKWSRSVVSDP